MIPIAFGHRKRVGKDTACKFLQSYLRSKGSTKNIQKGAFAYELKRQCVDLFGLNEPEFYEDNPEEREVIIKRLGKTPRQIWIEYGNKVRDVHPLVWVETLFRRSRGVDILLVSDCRYPNEADAIKAMGGYIIKIDRPDVPDTSDIADDALADYYGWNHVISNNGDLSNFYKEIENLATRFALV